MLPEPEKAAHADACLAALKAATANAHADIEDVPRLAALISPDLTLRAYGEVLQRFHAHFAACEPDLLGCLSGVVPAEALEIRTKLPLLQADLADLDLPVPRLAAQKGPDCAASAAGWLYVHEGTSLGGRVVLRSLQTTLGPSLGSARRYYEGYGKATAARWKESRRLIAGLITDETALERAIWGACRAFAQIEDVMVSDNPGRSHLAAWSALLKCPQSQVACSPPCPAARGQVPDSSDVG
ncbi:bacteriophytochrome heme oxygenase BphO [Rhodovulum sp. P5]|uniref:biliverdin-producing heme oxygenase n=1 Tax=Rhodovulum sp. P5 TaxID=1564506 RepID=UPI0009C329C6|nr:biliverdin-producing heme oxygenase [Rhodovulum sp. P5]ARE39247.1 bacteriophytochrome heme oxygenase BphO [Rhodovulum sp. P5]